MTQPLPTWMSLHKQAIALQQRKSVLLGRAKQMHADREAAVQQIKKSQDRVNASDSVRDILERLQQREHERAVGAYEELLTAFLTDVLPGEREIVMDLYSERGQPALDIFIRKGENMPLEDAWLGTGGSVTNLVSTGLRLISLLRSNKQRFLVLDESDCWIKPDLIPRYASLIQQMSEQLGVQIIMISHHDESLFSQHIPHRLRLHPLNKTLQAQWSDTSLIPDWSDETFAHRIEHLHLIDFQSHANTYIPLSPTVTLIQGDNDIGKSAIVNALKAVFDGEANDTYIKHFSNMSHVSLASPKHTLHWKRHRKGKVKCSYELIDNETQETLHHSDGTKPPEWMAEFFDIGRIEGLDVQIGQQQEPVFLINQSPAQRAKALSIGQESGHVNAMMSIDKQELQEAKNNIKQSEKFLEKSRHYVQIFTDLETTQNDWISQLQLHFDQHQTIERARHVLQRWRRFTNVIDHTQTLAPPVDLILPDMKHLHAQDLLGQWERANTIQHIIHQYAANQEQLELPKLYAGNATAIYRQWSKHQTVQQIYQELGEISSGLGQMPVLRQQHSRQLFTHWNRAKQKAEVFQALTQAPNLNLTPSSTDTARPLLLLWSEQEIIRTQTIQDICLYQQEEQITENMLKQHTCPTCHQILRVE